MIDGNSLAFRASAQAVKRTHSCRKEFSNRHGSNELHKLVKWYTSGLVYKSASQTSKHVHIHKLASKQCSLIREFCVRDASDLCVSQKTLCIIRKCVAEQLRGAVSSLSDEQSVNWRISLLMDSGSIRGAVVVAAATPIRPADERPLRRRRALATCPAPKVATPAWRLTRAIVKCPVP